MNGGIFVILFYPSPKKNVTKGVDRPVENPRKRAKNIQIAPNAPSKFY